MKIRIGHTPDADDAFMFYGFHHGQLDLEGLEIEHILEPMQSLNQRSLRGELEMTAFSFAAFSQACQHYRPITSGMSLGHGYGPMIITRADTPLSQIRSQAMASPGHLTTAHWLARLWNPQQSFVQVPFHQTLDRVREGQATSALVIHEGQMNFHEMGLRLECDLGLWWQTETGGLPIPLGVNGVRRDLPAPVQQQLAQALHDSIALALSDIDAAVDHALPLARGLDRPRAREFILRYVNASTLDPGPQGLEAVSTFYRRALEAGLCSQAVTLDWLCPVVSSPATS